MRIWASTLKYCSQCAAEEIYSPRTALPSPVHYPPIQAYLTPVASGLLTSAFRSMEILQTLSEIKLDGRKILDQELLHQQPIFIVNELSHLTPLQYSLCKTQSWK